MNNNLTGVILTAGMGTRLGGITADRPKGLVEVSGRPLLDYNIRFLRAAGANKIIAVAGFFGDKVKQYLNTNHPDVAVVQNDDYKKGNLYSLKTALPHIAGSFLLSNADHVYRLPIAELVRRQIYPVTFERDIRLFRNDFDFTTVTPRQDREVSECNGVKEGVTAFCDFDRSLGNDDMKVLRADDGRLAEIAKTLTRFHCGYVGLTYCPAAERETYHRAFSEVEQEYGDKAVVEQVLGKLAKAGHRVNMGDISGYGWLEIDFPEELWRAEEAVSKNQNDFL